MWEGFFSPHLFAQESIVVGQIGGNGASATFDGVEGFGAAGVFGEIERTITEGKRENHQGRLLRNNTMQITGGNLSVTGRAVTSEGRRGTEDTP